MFYMSSPMPNPFLPTASAVVGAVGSGLRTINDLLPGGTVTATSTPSLQYSPNNPFAKSLPGVPAQYGQDVSDVINHTGMGTSTILGELRQENGGNWSPTLQGKANPSDYGPAQINTSATGAGAELAKTPFFQNAYGHAFNVKNPDDNIKGMGVYLNYIRQYLLPSRGVKNPTNAQVIAAYNSLVPSIGKAYQNAVQKKTLIFSPPGQSTGASLATQ